MAVTLSPDEIRALLNALTEGRISPDAPRSPADVAAPYDLTSQDRIIRGQMPALDSVNENVAQLLGIGLTGRTRLALRVSTSPATLLKFADLNPLLAPPAAVCILRLGPGYGFGLVVLDAGLAEALLAAALGDRRTRGGDAPAEAHREFTACEQRVLKRLMGVATDALRSAWDGILPLAPEVVRFELDPRMASIAPPSDVGILSTFDISGGLQGSLQLVIPYSAVEPAKERLSAPRGLLQRSDDRMPNVIARELEQVQVDVRGVLGRTRIAFTRLLELAPGDLLLLDTDETKPLPVCVQGRDKLRAHPTISGGAMALIVERGVSAGRSPHPRSAP